MRAYKQYNSVKLSDGTAGFLIEDFMDGHFLFEFSTPGASDPYDQKVVSRDDIVGFAKPEDIVDPYAGESTGEAL